MKFLSKSYSFFVSSVAVALSLCVCSSAQQPSHSKVAMSKLLPEFTSYVQHVRKHWKVPGVAVAIVHDGKIIYVQGFGYRNSQKQPVTADTLFDIASLTKSFTAVMLGMQIQQGDYGWQTKIVSLLPGFKLYNNYATRHFAVRNLIAHDSGLPENALDGLGNFGYSTTHTLHSLRYIKPVTKFGTQFAYQDIFLAVAKQIIEQTSRRSFATDLHQWILNPLHMTRTYLRNESALKKMTNIAQPYLITYQMKNYPYSWSSPYLLKSWALNIGLAGGGIHSTARDMASWLIFNINQGAYSGQQLLNKKAMQFIHSPQTIISRNKAGQIELAYGEGWFIDQQSYRPYQMLYHMGGGTGMHAMMAYITQLKLGIVVLTNQYTNKVPIVLIRWLFDMYLYGKPTKDWNQYYYSQRLKVNLATEKLLKKGDSCIADYQDDLAQYIGAYTNPVYGKLIITRKNKSELSLLIGPHKISWTLSACKPQVLKAVWPNPNGMKTPMLFPGQDLLRFTISAEGKVIGMQSSFLDDYDGGNFMKR